MGITNLPKSYWDSENGSKFLKAHMEVNITANYACSIHNDFLNLLLPIMYSFIFLTGLISNISALLMFFFMQTKKNSIHIYLVNMALADLLLIVCLPFRIAYHANHNQWMLGRLFCSSIGILFYMNMYVSITLLGFISVDRYLKIIKPLQHYKLQKVTRSSMICCTLWCVSILLAIIILLHTKADNSTKCFHYKVKPRWTPIINLFLVILFWIVFFLLISSYSKIAKKLSKLKREKPGFSNKIFDKVVMKTFIIPFIFTVCFVPYHISRFFYIASQLQHTSCYWKNVANKTNEISLLLSALNSCLDPIMYFLLSKSVRRTVLSFINGKFQKDSRSETT
ncbi:probable G-protein coupled receptor 34b isoform X1 [Narcine bancroftii]|uniref:probable G-protein coupled receptor 34b isoform X1 n=1 Tax=Narcine bancroftii TaxID=1343680 RepID=UPI003831F69C